MKPHLTTSPSPATQLGARQGAQRCRGRRARRPARGRSRRGSCRRAVLMPVLPPTAASTMRQQRGRHVHDPDAAQPGRGDEAAEVGGRAAAEGDHRVGAGEAGLAERLPAVGGDRGGLGLPRRRAAGSAITSYAAPSASSTGLGQRRRGRRDGPRRPAARRRRAGRAAGRRGRARPRRRTATAPATGSTVRSSCRPVRASAGDDHAGSISRRRPRGLRPSVSTDERRHRLVDRGALVEQRLDPAADVAEQQRPGGAQPDPLDRVGRARPGGRPPVAGQQRRGCRGRAPLPRPARARRRAWPARRRRPRAPARGSAPRRSRRRCRRSLRPSAASTSCVGVAHVDAPALGEQPATVVLPAPIGPTSTDPRSGQAVTGTSGCPGSSRRCAGSPGTESPPNFSSDRLGQHQRDHRLGDDAGGRAPRRRRSAGGGRRSPRRWPRRRSAAPAARWRSASSRRAPAAPRRWSCRPRCRRSGRWCGGCPRRSATISSCACEPGVAASANPSPTSTPLIAWMPISAPASRESRRRSQCTCEPRPGRQAVDDDLDDAAEGVAVLVGLVDRAPPSPCCASGSRQRTGSSSRRATSSGSGHRARRAPGRRRARPRGRRRGRRRPARGSCVATRPSATRAAVSRAEARSRIGRASSKSYFCMPTRSAWPGPRPGQRGVAGQRRRARPGRPGRPTSPSPTWATRCCRSGSPPGRPGSRRGGRRRRS